ncbi:hypothetical protein [Streptomyces sp. NPDC050485]
MLPFLCCHEPARLTAEDIARYSEDPWAAYEVAEGAACELSRPRDW